MKTLTITLAMFLSLAWYANSQHHVFVPAPLPDIKPYWLTHMPGDANDNVRVDYATTPMMAAITPHKPHKQQPNLMDAMEYADGN